MRRKISVASSRCTVSEQTIKTDGVLSISRLPRLKLPGSRKGKPFITVIIRPRIQPAMGCWLRTVVDA